MDHRCSSTLALAVTLWLLPLLVSSAPKSGDCTNTTTHYYNVQRKSCCRWCQQGYYPSNAASCAQDVSRDCTPCAQDTFWTIRRGVPVCERCTERCSGDQVQVRNCTLFDRVCQCRSGFFCATPAQNTCRRCQRHKTCPPGQGAVRQGNATQDTQCKSCPAGTFSNISSASQPCLPHTDCAALGRTVLVNGSLTRDSVCAPFASAEQQGQGTCAHIAPGEGECSRGSFCASPAENTCRMCQNHTACTPGQGVARPGNATHDTLCEPCRAGTFSNVSSASQSCQPHTDCAALGRTVSVNGSLTQDRVCASLAPASPTPPTTLLPLSTTNPHLPTAVTVSDVPSLSSPVSDRSLEGKYSVLLVFLLPCVLLALVLCLRSCKGRPLKTLLKGDPALFLNKKERRGEREEEGTERLAIPELQERGAQVEVEQLLGSRGPAGSPVPELGGEGSHGSLQQVTVDHNGGGESINNTVGSIYIFSPGTVILGTSKPGSDAEEKKGESVAAAPGEAPVAFPQQESLKTPESEGPWDAWRGGASQGCIQEEQGKDLCYPVPATSK
ncbi:tumor necrosis factor receptor superfamily member 8 [Amia ocellicauda]|uniref:tumor necrosis factor receptor superfamily member 8 n=1 Tax=Amia ocellicauda TaxID=2972642 RepID=UPI003464E5D9